MVPLCATVAKVKEVSDMLHPQEADITDEELVSASQLVKVQRLVKVPGLEDRTPTTHEPMRPPDPRGMADHLTAPCKHKCAIFKQRRHMRQAHRVLVSLDPVRSALMRASSGQFGLGSSCCSASTVEAVVGLDHPGLRNKYKASESAMCCDAILHCVGLHYHYARLESSVLLEVCTCFNAPLWDRSLWGSRANRIFAWYCHTGRCGGDERRLQSHEKGKST